MENQIYMKFPRSQFAQTGLRRALQYKQSTICEWNLKIRITKLQDRPKSIESENPGFHQTRYLLQGCTR